MNLSYIACWISNIFLLLFGLIFTFLFGFYIRSNTITGNCKPLKEKQYFAHRAFTNEYQENSLEAIVAAAKAGHGVEMDIFLLKTGELVIFHDDNCKDLTGIDRNIIDLTYDEVKQMRYLKTVRNTTYATQPKIPLLSEVLEAACTIDKKQLFNLDLKLHYSDKDAENMFNILDNSPCECFEDQLIFDTPYPNEVTLYKYAMEKHRCKGKMKLYFHQGTVPFGVHFWLRSRFSVGFGGVDAISFHYFVWDKYGALIKAYEDDGFCTSIYGNYRSFLDNYDPSHDFTVDVSDASLSHDPFDPSEAIFNCILFFMVFGTLALIASIVIFYLLSNDYICQLQEVENTKPLKEDLDSASVVQMKELSSDTSTIAKAKDKDKDKDEGFPPINEHSGNLTVNTNKEGSSNFD